MIISVRMIQLLFIEKSSNVILRSVMWSLTHLYAENWSKSEAEKAKYQQIIKQIELNGTNLK